MVGKVALVLLFAGLLLAGYLAYTWFLPPGTPLLPPQQNATATPASPNATATPSLAPSASAAPTVTVSPTPKPLPLPTITKVNFTLNGTTANVSWNASLPGYPILQYGPTETLGKELLANETLSQPHLLLQNLSFKTKYFFKVGTCAPQGCGYSELQSFTTPRKSCAAGMTYFDAKDFCIDRYEASMDPIRRIPLSGSGKNPWILLSYPEASAACASVGKRLCTSAEFTAACNMDGQAYGLIGTSCQVEGTNYNKTGEVNCTSREGVHDLIGNVGEWVSDLATPDTPFSSGFTATDKDPLAFGSAYEFPRAVDSKTEKYGNDYYSSLVSSSSFITGTGVVRGGDYTSGMQAGCYAFQVGVSLDTKNSKTGFRCCS